MTILRSMIILTLCFYLIACNVEESGNKQILTPDTVIATYTHGNLTISELKSYIIKQPLNDRWSTTDPTHKFSTLINKAAIEKQMISEANLMGIEQSHQFKFRQRDEIKKLYVKQYLSNQNSHISVNDEDIENYYQEHLSKYNLPEQRYVYHIFKSNQNPNAKQEITAIRKRVLAGENFKLLAKELSESESRHTKGFLGRVKKGDFPNEFDKIVFNLELHIPSSVAKTKDGYHLFLVTEKLKQKNFQINEIRNTIHKEILAELAVKKVKELALSLPLPDPLVILNIDEFNSALKDKSPQVKLYQIGEQHLSVLEFIFTLQELAQKNPKLDIQEKAYRIFQENAYSEVIYQHMINENIQYTQPNILQSKSEALLIEEFSKTKLRTYINKHPELIKNFFNKNKKRYTTPIKMNIQLLMIPIIEGINLMPTLEISREKLDENEITLEELANDNNGKTIISGLMETQQLSKLNKNITRFASDLKIDRHSAPFTNNGYYNIIKLIAKTTEKSKPLSLIREKVVNDYIKNYKAQIFTDMTKPYTEQLSIDNKTLKLFIKETLINLN